MTILSSTTVVVASGNNQVYALPAVNPGVTENLNSIAFINTGAIDAYVTTGGNQGLIASSSGTLVSAGETALVTPSPGDIYFAAITGGDATALIVARGI